MIKLMMAVVWLSGSVDHVELKGSKYATMDECWQHVRQLTFTNHHDTGGTRRSWNDAVIGGGFYCEESKGE